MITLPTKPFFIRLSLLVCTQLWLLLNICGLFAQQKLPIFSPEKKITQFLIGSWTNDNGLPSNIVNAIIQTQDGYIWAATYDGLIRFDGINFTLFDRSNTKSFRTNSFVSLYETPEDSTLWIGSEGSGLLAYKNGEFRNYDVENGTTGRIDYIYKSPKGKFLIGTRGAGVYELVGKKLQPYANFPYLKDNVKCIVADKENSAIWFGCEGVGLVKQEGEKYKIYTSLDGLPDNKINSLFWDNKGQLWVGTSTGTVILDTKTNKITPLSFLQGSLTHKILQDGLGDFWLATNKGLVRLKADLKTYEILDETNGLYNKWVRDIIFDKEGSMWLASYRGGLSRMRDAKFTNYTQLEGLGSNVINHVAEIAPNHYLIACDNKNIYQLKNGILSIFPITSKIDNERVRYIFKDSKQNLWISTEKGLIKITPNGTEKVMNEKTGLPDNMVNQVFEDRKGYIWLGTRTGGLIKILADDQYEVYNKKNGFGSNFVMAIEQNQKGDLIVATNDAGIHMISTDNMKIVYNIEKGLPTNVIFRTYSETNGNMWIVSNAGLLLLREGKIHQFGIFTKYAFYDILVDSKQNFWLPSAKGIIQVEKQTLLAYLQDTTQRMPHVMYGKHDGMKHEQCVGATHSLKAKNGVLWFNTLGGIATINPESIKVNSLLPNIVIESFYADNAWIDTRNTITLPPYTQRFVFHYTALSLQASPKVQFKYKLEKLDKTWIDVGTERSAVYTNLDAGTYTFSVIACNNDGYWNEKGATLTFKVKPYFYETWWFYSLVALLVILSAIAFYYLRVAVIQKRNEELEKMVKQRTAELNQQKEEIETQRDNIQQQSEKLSIAYDEVQFANSKILEQKDILQEQFSQIEKSVQAAKVIQQAILPFDERISKFLKEYFVIYKPKDVVSGDFYWIEEHADKIFVAVVDCTGHGVPGAFMSMIGNTLLDHIVKVQNVHSPEKILIELNIEIEQSLKQKQTKDNNGMDIAMMMWEKTGNKVYFAGAKRNLYYVLPNQNEVQTVLGDRKSIGGLHNENHQFHLQEFEKQDNTMIYLSTDGFTDQCDITRAKFSVPRLEKLIAENAALSCIAQKEIFENTLNKFQAEALQRDDILLVAVKL
jgi:ligand-binding sensor domain-containing protein/serine phosphatase RsbU (regulator of sigma subunit)